MAFDDDDDDDDDNVSIARTLLFRLRIGQSAALFGAVDMFLRARS
jgi:hypothetical protein